jgi:hypothetical protein
MTPAQELSALGAFYGVPVDHLLAAHGPALARYAEWVLARDSFALVTLGTPEALARLGHSIAGARFLAAAARWPAAVAGIKLDPTGYEEPTLYLRTLCPWSEAVAWLEAAIGPAASAIPASRTAYGLGFQGDRVKTYALAPDGFVSYRLTDQGLCVEHKDYRADVAWNDIPWPDPRWSAIGALGRSLGFEVAGHVGDSSSGERKVYVERVGGIPTDRSFA